MKKVLLLSVLASSVLLGTSLTSCKNSTSQNDIAIIKNEDGSYNMKFAPKVGTHIAYVSSIDQTMNMSDMTTKSQTTADYSYQVKEAKDGNNILEIMYTRMVMDMEAMGSKIKIDSDDKNSTESKSIREIMNKAFSIKVNNEGKVLSVDGWDKIEPTGTIKSEELIQTMEMSLNIFPDKAVKIGDSWTKDIQTNLQMFKMNVKSTYTLKEVKGDIATISSKSTISTEPGASANGMNISMQGTQEGDMEIDLKTGLAMNANIIQDISGKMNAQGEEMPMQTKSIIKITGKAK